MVKSCSVKNCKAVWTTTEQNTFHKLPANSEIREKWLNSIPRGLLPKVTVNTLICNKHFENDCYEMGSVFRRRLKKDAIPTIFQETNENRENNMKSRSIVDTSTEHVSRGIFHTDKESDNSASNNACAANISDFPDTTIISEGSDIAERSTPTEIQDVTKSPRRKTIHNGARMEGDDVADAKKIKKDVAVQVEKERLPPSPKVKSLQRKIKVLQQRLKRRDKAVISMKSLIGRLKKNGKCTTALRDALETNFSGLTIDAIRNEFQSQNIASTRARYYDGIPAICYHFILRKHMHSYAKNFK